MRSYMNPDKFFKKMKKKPELQAVLDKIGSYSDDDIDNLQGTHFPLWIKEELKKLNKRDGKSAEEMAEILAAKMVAASKTLD